MKLVGKSLFVAVLSSMGVAALATPSQAVVACTPSVNGNFACQTAEVPGYYSGFYSGYALDVETQVQIGSFRVERCATVGVLFIGPTGLVVPPMIEPSTGAAGEC